MTEEKQQRLKSFFLGLGDTFALPLFGFGIFTAIFCCFATMAPQKNPTIVPQICYAIGWLGCGIWVVRRSRATRKTLAAIWFGIGISFVSIYLMQSVDSYRYPRVSVDRFEEVARELTAAGPSED